MIDTFIINKNRLTTTKNLVNWLSKESRLKIYVVDNGSTYKPLIDYYNSEDFKSKAEVIWMTDKDNYLVVWTKGLLDKYKVEGKYIVTDSDLDCSNIPDNWLDYLLFGLNCYPLINKVGFSLDIFNIPNDNPLKSNIITHENRFWMYNLDGRFYNAEIDTTFALHRENQRTHTYTALRSSKPYMAIHQPWMVTPSNLTEEDVYYYEHISKKPGDSHWSKFILQEYYKNKNK
jgi:hypothetical protein